MKVGAPGFADMHQAVAVAHARSVARYRMGREDLRLLRRKRERAAVLHLVGKCAQERQHIVGSGRDAARAEGYIDPWGWSERHSPRVGSDRVGGFVPLRIKGPVFADNGAASPAHSKRDE